MGGAGERAKLAQLARLAELKSELELKRFAAFSANMVAVRQRIESAESTIAACYTAAAPMSLDEARIASAEAGEAARQAARARRELQQMLPRFDLARQRAAREFGRATALDELARQKGRG